MKRFIAISTFFLAALAGVGCRAQMPPQPPVYQCPPAVVGGTAYTPLNAPASNTVAASITGLSFSTTPSSIGTWCYIVQSWAIISPATTYQDSAPSNVAMVTTTTALPVVNLTWNAPANSNGYTYIVSAAPAVLVGVPTAPTLSAAAQ